MSELNFLRIEGRVVGGFQYVPEPGHETRRMPHRFEGCAHEAHDSRWMLVLLDREGSPLARSIPEVRDKGCGHGGGGHRARLTGYLPLLGEAAAYEVRSGDICLYRAEIAETP